MSTFFSISDAVYLSKKETYSLQTNSPIVLCDFDGTISLDDVTDTLLAHFGQDGCDELEARWEAGEIGSQECMSKQIALLDASLDEVNQVLAGIEIDPYFKAFVRSAQDNNIAVHIVSDGLDYAIKTILANHQLDFLPVYANTLLHDNVRGWSLQFPYSDVNCQKQSGNCKCSHVRKQCKNFFPILYVGDGSSDFCVSNKVDYVFAKDKLIDFCQHNQINHRPINSFDNVIELIPTIRKTFQSRLMRSPLTNAEYNEGLILL
ncbi:HAD superfamily phosphoserine phosphatase-like hydrolase/2,3-diketo-5-methylthio-1-phosphopentane phosphatase [Orbus hercynius]|uniref:HAD superfamily phosphoserine phosphatase-like hydrolase/2,3-diketo-5-methylthio-1-phosphopentane phosphatase n=1 Tax=Orbus hercynius TaxID=593135 RepID=A0A495RF03_9GAMM|nr:MtnX-like HAD-IB family phosphatase [Orbus hercynius]RKS86082.1 HAD superfamily phosphoserine phosphatase-like hydrolase/2,3-diketo-5-methylthio-1-phosphopentane phosphatase [Orbus hercynius]